MHGRSSLAEAAPGRTRSIPERPDSHIEALQDRLERLEARLQTYTNLYEFAPVGNVSLESHGLVTRVNFQLSGLLGVGRCALVGEPFARWVRPGDRAAYESVLRRLRRGDTPGATQVCLVRARGSELWAILRGAGTYDGHGALQETHLSVTPLNDIA